MEQNRIGLGSRANILAAILTASIVAVSPLGCGKTTSLGDARAIDGGGSGGESGVGGNTLGSAGQGGESGNASGGSAGQAGGGASGSSAGSTAGDAGTSVCKVPRPPAKTNVTQEELDRAALVGELCQNFADQNCLDGLIASTGSVSAQAIGCGQSDRVLACQQDALLAHLRQIAPECEDEWRALIACGIGAEYTPEMCRAMGVFGRRHDGGQTPCSAEEAVLNECARTSSPGNRVTGSRATCSYGIQPEDSQCIVNCELSDKYIWAECTGNPGLPLECICNVNTHRLHDVWADRYQFYVGDCRDAAQTVANGECINRLDCCFTYFGGSGKEYCECTSNPAYKDGSSCEELARQGGGRTVDICPQYKLDPGACWPPSDCP
jgi:hypothetical protein